MSIAYQVLGAAGRDNAVYVRVLTGKAVHRLLLDCGDGCVTDLSVSEALAVDHLLFSHLHMDHIGGFDNFFRITYNRAPKPNEVWGPPRTAAIMRHRLRGFMWNLFEGDPGIWYVNDVHPDRIERTCFKETEAFALAHPAGTRQFDGMLFANPDYTVTALSMDHHTPSLAYVIREAPHVNVATERLDELGLLPGPWLRQLKQLPPDAPATLTIDGQIREWAELRAELLVETPGESLAYLTDFLLDEPAVERLVPALRGCTTVICESQYRSADEALATRHRHMTGAQAAELARRAEVGRLILFHLSTRYRPAEWRDLLAEARAIFPSTAFPDHWQVGATE
ncbi:MAG TPA: MBL fold metallo-hydrolase [Ktedonobacterales bacterium]|nr:MBL fold metallo-hydrolase [Ktedonobacterales bacterium]